MPQIEFYPSPSLSVILVTALTFWAHMGIVHRQLPTCHRIIIPHSTKKAPHLRNVYKAPTSFQLLDRSSLLEHEYRPMAPPRTDRFLAISCINVGVGPGGTTNLLAHIAIVNFLGETLFDKYVRPTTTVTDYRTQTTGVTEEHLFSAEAWLFNDIQQYVANAFRGKVLVGHSLWQDLSVLGIPHPAVETRDVALYQPFRNSLRSPNQTIGLQTLAWQLMQRRCQEGQIHPIENARAALDLYRSDADAWETAISQNNWPCALPPSTFSRCYL